MTTRMVTSTVVFGKPFTLDEIDETLPPGSYRVETEEETLDNVSFIAYRRIATHFFVPSRPGVSSTAQMYMIHPKGLERALSRDRATPH
jgi:hypothetical protein